MQFNKTSSTKSSFGGTFIIRDNRSWLVFSCFVAVCTGLYFLPQLHPFLKTGIFFALVTTVMALLSQQAKQKQRHLNTALKSANIMNADLVAKNQEIKKDLDSANELLLERSKFLAAASHDLRQPLQSIGLLLYSLENRLDDPKLKEIIIDLEKSHKAMSSLFGSLLEISKIDADALEVDRSNVSMKRVMSALETELRPLAAAKGLSINFAKSSSFAYSDEVLLSRIIRNLVHNAVVHTEAGRINIDIDEAPKSLTIKITDTGPGIPDEELSNIFSEFYQLKSSGNRSEGVGLGLSIVSRLCVLLGHDINVSSQLGKGTTFTLKIARSSAKQTAISSMDLTSINPVDHMIGTHVLVVDDDPVNLRAMTETLRSWGCIVTSASDAVEAHRLFKANAQITFAVFDYHLGNQLGTTAFKRLSNERREGFGGLLVTGDLNPSIVKEAQLLGMMVLPKPIQPAKLRNAINRSITINTEGF